MKQFQKLVSTALTITTSLALSGIGLAGMAYAAPISNATATISNSLGGQTSVGYTIKFTASNTAIKAITLQWRTAASGGGVVNNLNLTGAGLTSLLDSGNGNAATGLAIDTTGAASDNLRFHNSSAYAPSGAPTYNIILTGITNNNADNTCDSVANSDTCYIIVTTWADEAATTTPVDTGVVSYTVINNVNVTATVDPSLTFTVTGITTTAALQTNDSNAGCAASADVAASAVAIPFGDIKVNTYKCAQQSLAVATNATNGYNVKQVFLGATANVVMAGTLSGSNVLNAFNSGSAFTSPTTWFTPTSTTPNSNTGFVGLRTTNAGVAGSIAAFSSNANWYGAPGNNGTPVIVMDRAGADLGTSPSYLTYKIEVNAAQPADTYTGTINYNVLGKY